MKIATVRVHGFDFLRGLCAIAVAFYHVLGWNAVGHLRAIGLYGVYVFFLLSGASIYIAYADRFRNGYDLRHFIAQRALRLAPMMGLAVLLGPFVAHYHFGTYDFQFWKAAFFNVSFAFGLGNPAMSSLVTGGWSLGIEFTFYLIFPVIAAFLRGGVVATLLSAIFAVLVQRIFVSSQVTPAGTFKDWGLYTQFAAFVGYFVVGCAIGKLRLGSPGKWGGPAARIALWAAALFLFSALATGDGKAEASPLIGLRGVVLFLASSGLVLVSAYLYFPGKLTFAAAALGNMSYGLYLLHPLVYAVLKRHFDSFSTSQPLVFCSLVVISAAASALLLERWYERPLIDLGKQYLGKGRAAARPVHASGSPLVDAAVAAPERAAQASR